MLRTLILSSLFMCLAVAAPNPTPQDINFPVALVVTDPQYSIDSDATAQTVTYDAASILADVTWQYRLPHATHFPPQRDGFPYRPPHREVDHFGKVRIGKREAECEPLPVGSGPVPSPDTHSAFEQDPAFGEVAWHARTPAGYAPTFVNLNASANAYGYLGFREMTSYDPEGCAAVCDEVDGCISINIYFERAPTVVPGPNCPDPPSTTRIKCALWGGPVNEMNAAIQGTRREDFHVRIAGSNGYSTIARQPVLGFSMPAFLKDTAISAPLDVFGVDTHLGSVIFNKGPFNASLCAHACSDMSTYALNNPPADGSEPLSCHFFNTYILYLNDSSHYQGQVCSMYSETWPSDYATNQGQWHDQNHFLIEHSYAYSNSSDPGRANQTEAVAQAVHRITASSLLPFCSEVRGWKHRLPEFASATVTTPAGTVASTTTLISTASTFTTDSTTIFVDPAPTTTLLKRQLPSKKPEGLDIPQALYGYPRGVIHQACDSALGTPPDLGTFTATFTEFVAPVTNVVEEIGEPTTVTVSVTDTKTWTRHY